jgi:putative glycosyltransferase (TIGR04372 family)
MTMLYRLCDWIGKVTRTIVLTPHPTAVGNCAEHIYYGLLKARRERKKLIILFPYEWPWRAGRFRWRFRRTNIELVSVESEYRALSLDSPLCIAGSALIAGYFAFFRTLSLVRRLLFGRYLSEFHTRPLIGTTTLWQPEERMPGFSWDVIDKYDWRKQLEEPLKVSIGKQKRLIAERQRVRMGLPEDAWFVCLHVREGGFHNDYTEPQRNANIINYIGAMGEVVSRGGWVVRMGDATMTKLPVMERVIDYPFSEAKSALMDMYLISECRAYIGMASGIFEVAVLFRRPIIATNMPHWLIPTSHKCGISLFKHIYSRSRKKFLSVREWLAEPFEANAIFSRSDDYVYYDNDPEELRAVVKEFFDRDDNWEPTPLQRQFNELRVCSGRKLLSGPITSGDAVYDIHQRYRFAARLDSAAGVVGAEFLQKNWEDDARNSS